MANGISGVPFQLRVKNPTHNVFYKYMFRTHITGTLCGQVLNFGRCSKRQRLEFELAHNRAYEGLIYLLTHKNDTYELAPYYEILLGLKIPKTLVKIANLIHHHGGFVIDNTKRNMRLRVADKGSGDDNRLARYILTNEFFEDLSLLSEIANSGNIPLDSVTPNVRKLHHNHLWIPTDPTNVDIAGTRDTQTVVLPPPKESEAEKEERLKAEKASNDSPAVPASPVSATTQKSIPNWIVRAATNFSSVNDMIALALICTPQVNNEVEFSKMDIFEILHMEMNFTTETTVEDFTNWYATLVSFVLSYFNDCRSTRAQSSYLPRPPFVPQFGRGRGGSGQASRQTPPPPPPNGDPVGSGNGASQFSNEIVSNLRATLNALAGFVATPYQDLFHALNNLMNAILVGQPNGKYAYALE